MHFKPEIQAQFSYLCLVDKPHRLFGGNCGGGGREVTYHRQRLGNKVPAHCSILQPLHVNEIGPSANNASGELVGPFG